MNTRVRLAVSARFRRAGIWAVSVPLVTAGVVLLPPDAAIGADTLSGASLVVPADAGSLGIVPDGPGTPTLCGSAGTPRNVTFPVPAFPGFQVADVEVEMSFAGPVHTFAGDITSRLIDPSGSRDHVLFGRVLATTAAACGDASDLAGPYVFSDVAVPSLGGWWQAATAETTSTAPIVTGDYRTTNSGGAGATNPMPPTSMQPVFGGMTSGEAQGTWTLRIVDSGGGDTGAIASASLTIYLEPSDLIFENDFELQPVL